MELSEDVIELGRKAEAEVQKELKEIDELCEYHSLRVLQAFQKYHVSDIHFNSTTGYGYSDVGRDTIEKIFAEVLHTEDSLVRSQLISGTHALAITLSALLRPGDTMLSITGEPYDTLQTVIGIGKEQSESSLKVPKIKRKQGRKKHVSDKKVKKRIDSNDLNNI